MKRVVHLTTVHHLQDPRIFHKQCQSLDKAGYEVYLIVQHTQAEVLQGVYVEALPIVGKNYGARLGLQRLAYRKAVALRADLYHIHDPELIPLAYWLKKRTGARVIYDMHEDYLAHGGIQGRVLRLLERWCFRWVDHIVVANVMQQRVVMGSNVTVVANHIKPLGRQPEAGVLPTSGNPIRLLYTGVIAGIRGLFDMIALAKAIQERELSWVIDLVGVVYIEADRKKADELIECYGLSSIVQRVGWSTFVQPEAMVSYYEQAHIGLALLRPQSSYIATIPTKFFEYTYYGLPIICSDFPGWRAFLRRYRCGKSVQGREPDAVIAAIQEIIESPRIYQTMAQQGQQAAKAHFLWDATAEQLIRVYKDLLA